MVRSVLRKDAVDIEIRLNEGVTVQEAPQTYFSFKHPFDLPKRI